MQACEEGTKIQTGQGRGQTQAKASLRKNHKKTKIKFSTMSLELELEKNILKVTNDDHHKLIFKVAKVPTPTYKIKPHLYS